MCACVNAHTHTHTQAHTEMRAAARAYQEFAPLLTRLELVQLYTAVWNALEMPVTQVPVGVSVSEGLPLGIQVILLCSTVTEKVSSRA